MYIELHARSAFSFLEGASSRRNWSACARNTECQRVALLDRDGVYGAPRLHLAAKKMSIRAHVGAEVTSPDGWRYPLLVESRAGYQNLCRLITRMKLRARKGEGTFCPKKWRKAAAGLICLTGGEEGPLAHALAQGGSEAGVEMRAAALRAIRPRKCVRRIAAAFFPRGGSAQSGGAGNRAQIALCRCWRPTACATRSPQQREVLDVFTCIRHHRTLATAGRLLTRNAERHLKSPAEMARCLPIFPKPSPIRRFSPRACNSP